MNNKAQIRIMLTLFLFISMLTSASNVQIVKAEPTIILVPDDYPRIQDAIDAARAGDTILVLTGYYAEGQVNITKPLTLLGKGKVIVDGLQKGWCTLWVTSSEVTIKGLAVINGGHGVGIELDSVRNCVIEENVFTKNACIHINSGRSNRLSKNIVTDNDMGITLAMASHNVIEQNIISDNRYSGIKLWLSDCNSIRENVVKNNGWTSIYIDCSYWNNISENIIEDNFGGIAVASDSMYNTIVENKIRNNEYSGIVLGPGHYNVVKENKITGNQYGIQIWQSQQNIVKENRILRNTCWGISVTHWSDGNTVSENVVLHSGEYDLHWDQSGHCNLWAENKYKTKDW